MLGNGRHVLRHYSLFVHRSLQNYNFVWTVNGDMSYSLAVVRLPIRKPGPHNSWVRSEL